MKNWRIFRKNLLFWLSAAFAVLFLAALVILLFADVSVTKTAVPPFLGFCFTYPLYRRNRKQTPGDPNDEAAGK